MKYENVDRLLSALDRYVFEGRPEGMAEGGMVPAMASVDRSGSDMEAAHAAWTGEAINLAEAGNLAQEHERLVSRRVTRKRAEKNLARDLT